MRKGAVLTLQLTRENKRDEKGCGPYPAVNKRGRRFPGGPLRSLTVSAADSGSIPRWEDKISPAVWPEDKKKRRERKPQPWGHREKWENHGDPNLHFANEETRSKKNISNSLEIFLGLQNDCRW